MLLAESVLRVRCLGAFSFRAEGAWSCGPAFKRGREFLQYFVSYPRAAASREVLVNVFWPTLDAETAAHRLHLAAAGARAALRAVSPEVDGIRSSGGAYAWDPAIVIESDAVSLLAAGRGNSLEEMERAASLYAGDYLAGDEAEWMYPLRVRCANAYAVILERLAMAAITRKDFAAGLEYALRLLEADRAHEAGTRLAMRTFAAMGRRGAALAVYDALSSYLHHHLALQPSAQTNELRARIVADAPIGIIAD
jgi:DNA-binding SARP family transcriptional activator